MNLVTDILESYIGDEFFKKAGKRLNLDSKKTKSVVQQSLPFLLGALAKNSSTEAGAKSLSIALQRDHDGSILKQLDGLINRPEESSGSSILKHVFGENQTATETYISQENGVNKKEVTKVFQMLAPIVMGGLGKMQKEGHLDATQLSSLLQLAISKTGKINMLKFIMKFLDKNGDGDVKDDLLNMGKNWLFKKFKK
jgi:hypothetical protein